MAKEQLLKQIDRQLKMYGNYLEQMAKKKSANKGSKTKSGKS